MSGCEKTSAEYVGEPVVVTAVEDEQPGDEIEGDELKKMKQVEKIVGSVEVHLFG